MQKQRGDLEEAGFARPKRWMHSAYIERTIRIEEMRSNIHNEHGILTRHQEFGWIKAKSRVGKKVWEGQKPGTNYGGLCRKIRKLMALRYVFWASPSAEHAASQLCLTTPWERGMMGDEIGRENEQLTWHQTAQLFSLFLLHSPKRIWKLYHLTHGNFFFHFQYK